MEQQTYLVGLEGAEMSVDCSITYGSVPAALSIYFNNVIVPSIAMSVKHQSYKLNLEAKHHLSRVKCLAFNAAGEAEKVYLLFVKGKEPND